MKEVPLGDSAVRSIRIVAITIGALLLLAAIFANVLGFSVSGGLSRNQISFGAIGLVLIAAGLLGRRFPGFYRGAAVVLLNVIVLIVVLDLAALVLVKLIDPDRFSLRAAKLEQGLDEEFESAVTISSYVPYVLWRSEPSFQGGPVAIDDDGRRITPGSSVDEAAYTVFLLGGSAMWGADVGDRCTIGAYLLEELETRLERPVSVMNLAQNAHASTQEVIELMLELRSGNVPDLVIFYDGFNDVWAANESGIAGVHTSYLPIAARIEGRDAAFRKPLYETLFQGSNLWLLLTSLRAVPSRTSLDPADIVNHRTMGVDTEVLASEVVDIYFENASLAEHLAGAYGFEVLFVWQPTIWCGSKSLTEEELEIEAGLGPGYSVGLDPAMQDLLNSAYALYESTRPDTARYVTFQGVFDGEVTRVYTDQCGAHVTAEANQRLAEILADRVLELDLELTPDVIPMDRE